MSEPKLISPMLDNFDMGEPISSHDGVQCCPAMEKSADDKYIVKIISVPASQTQVDALLLSGAYSCEEDALAYYKELSDAIVEEAQVLKKLSELEGFLPAQAWQVVPKEEGTGFDVYLLTAYCNTLQQTFRRGTMTHLGALNLGLDLCSALSVCRRSGYLYVDLKPANVYITADNGYRIGDLGFMNLDSLKYASLPQRYRSQYTAPEITDAFAALNTTMDVYALGLILYQAFNDGQLPFKEDIAPSQQFPAPAYADYEMAEIILKACDPDPEARWQDPAQMGQALVSYMQRNGAHDTPIVPVPEPEEEIADDVPQALEEDAAQDTALTQEDMQDEPTQEADSVSDEPPEITEQSIYSEDAEGNLTFIEDVSVDETAPGEETADIDYNEVTDEVSDMLEQADELIAHEAPDPVVQPEPIDVPIPPPIILESEPIKTDIKENTKEESEEPSAEEETAEDAQEKSTSRKKRRLLPVIIICVFALALIICGVLFYRLFYLQKVDSLSLETTEDGVLSVYVVTQIPSEKLTVVCMDTYGNKFSSDVKEGRAVFSELTPGSAYNVKVKIDGFHRLIGDTSTAYTAPSQTQILQFTAVTGTTDGSVILSFTIDGPDSDQWVISYPTSDDTTKYVSFSGHIITLSDLPVGEEITFTLDTKNPMNIAGTTELKHLVSTVVTATDLNVTGIIDGTLTAEWSCIEGAAVDGWTVRCYNDDFDQTIVTQEPAASFEIPDSTAAYTIEVTATGMSVSERTFVAENSVSVTDLTIDDSDPNKLVLSWSPVVEQAAQGWILLYTVNGSATQEITVSSGNTVTLEPAIPGSVYTFNLQTAGSGSVLGGSCTYTSGAPAAFSGYGVDADNMTFRMCITPAWSNWDRYDVPNSDYTTEFKVGENASFLVKLNRAYETSSDQIVTLFVIRDENGGIVSTATTTSTWRKMWYNNYCELDVPSIPQTPGSYTVSVYFNGQLANETDFTVVSE